MIDGSFTTATPNVIPGVNINGATIASYFPTAKAGDGNYIYVWSGGYNGGNGINYFGLSAVNYVYAPGLLDSEPGLHVQQAYNIDKKIDDGLPQSGQVSAMYLSGHYSLTPVWSANAGIGAPGTAATAGSSSTCYDNGNVGGATQQYSMTQNGGSGPNCALSFQFQ